MEARSVTCKDQWLTPEKRKKVVETTLNDLLAASQYTQLTFVSTQIAPKSKGQFEVQGDLTVCGISKRVSVQAAVKPVGEVRLEIDGEAHISLKDYGLKPPSSAWGLAGTRDQMTLRSLVWAEKPA